MVEADGFLPQLGAEFAPECCKQMFILCNSCWIHSLDSLYTGNSISDDCIRMMLGGPLTKEDGNEAGRDEVVEEKRYGDFD